MVKPHLLATALIPAYANKCLVRKSGHPVDFAFALVSTSHQCLNGLFDSASVFAGSCDIYRT
jgi:hypothetical protein